MHPPSWWQNEDGSLLPKYLGPLGSVYGQIVKARFTYTKPYDCKLPIICVGNFTLGGTGKTPIAIKVAHILQSQGWYPSFLSKGYKGKSRGPLLVDPAEHSANDVGDEPLLLADHAPTVIAKNRVEGAWLLEQRRTDLIIMDDGFQNPTLDKTLNLIAIDSKTKLGNERIFPAGPLRAPLAFQLAKADALIITGSEPLDLLEELQTKYKFEKPILTGHVSPNEDTEWLKDKPILAYAGIARPEKLFDSLSQAGGKVIRRIPFPDHYTFTSKDAAHLTKLALKDDLQLVTTQKDLVRINEEEHHQLRALKRMSHAFPVEFTFNEQDEKKLIELIKEKVPKPDQDA